MKKKSSVGVMGGTFNPIHFGHLVTAEEAYSQFKLDKVIFMPSGKPPHKEVRETTPAEDRYLMTVLAIAGNPHFSISRLEIERKGLSYTIDTVKELHKTYGSSWEIFFITGADAIIEILTWKDPHQLAEYCSFIAATRPGYSLEKFRQALYLKENELNKFKPRIYFMEIPALAISSTDIRKRVKEGKSIKYLLPDVVAEYIYQCRLYVA